MSWVGLLCKPGKLRYIARFCDTDDRQILNYDGRFRVSALQKKIDQATEKAETCSTSDEETGKVTVCKCTDDLCNGASVMSYCMALVIAALTSLLTSS